MADLKTMKSQLVIAKINLKIQKGKKDNLTKKVQAVRKQKAAALEVVQSHQDKEDVLRNRWFGVDSRVSNIMENIETLERKIEVLENPE